MHISCVFHAPSVTIFNLDMRKIGWGPDSGMIPTKAAKTASTNKGRPEITEAKSKFCIRNSNTVRGTKI
jgi:hypothetical protein